MPLFDITKKIPLLLNRSVHSSIKRCTYFHQSTPTLAACEFSGTKVSLSLHYSDVIMSAMASQITGVSTVCITVCSGADQRKYKAPRHWYWTNHIENVMYSTHLGTIKYPPSTLLPYSCSIVKLEVVSSMSLWVSRATARGIHFVKFLLECCAWVLCFLLEMKLLLVLP